MEDSRLNFPQKSPIRLVAMAIQGLLVGLIRCYRYVISPVLGPRCRFVPSCSDYAIEAVQQFGIRRGGLMVARRLTRCHPWGGSGFDPVPDVRAMRD